MTAAAPAAASSQAACRVASAPASMSPTRSITGTPSERLTTASSSRTAIVASQSKHEFQGVGAGTAGHARLVNQLFDQEQAPAAWPLLARELGLDVRGLGLRQRGLLAA